MPGLSSTSLSCSTAQRLGSYCLFLSFFCLSVATRIGLLELLNPVKFQGQLMTVLFIKRVAADILLLLFTTSKTGDSLEAVADRRQLLIGIFAGTSRNKQQIMWEHIFYSVFFLQLWTFSFKVPDLQEGRTDRFNDKCMPLATDVYSHGRLKFKHDYGLRHSGS